MAEKALAHNLASTRTVCEVLFPDSIRTSGLSLNDIATFTIAVEPAVTFTTLTKLGWTTDQWADWAIQFLTVFLNPDWVAENLSTQPKRWD